MEQTRGNFRINLNRNKKPGDSQPMFDRGIISTPDNPDTQYELKLWAYTDKHGRSFYAGPSSIAATDASALERANALMQQQAADMDTGAVKPDGPLQLAEHQVMLFPNGFKIAQNDARYAALTDEDKALNDRRPEVWGYWNPGNGAAQLRIAAWDMPGRYGPFLGGNTQYPQPGKNIAVEAQPDAPAAGAKAAPKSKGRSSDPAR
jgi:hypothetical protein